MKLGVVLLAAGKSTRFGANKLLAGFCGRPMVCYSLEAAAALKPARTAVVTGCGEVACLAEGYGFEVIVNDAPQLGQSHSIQNLRAAGGRLFFALLSYLFSGENATAKRAGRFSLPLAPIPFLSSGGCGILWDKPVDRRGEMGYHNGTEVLL